MTAFVVKQIKKGGRRIVRPIVRFILRNSWLKCSALQMLKLFPRLKHRLHNFASHEGMFDDSELLMKDVSRTFKQEVIRGCSSKVTGVNFWKSQAASNLKEVSSGHVDYGLVKLVRSSENLDNIFSLSDDLKDCVIVIFLAFLRRYPREDDIENYVTFIRGKQGFDEVRKRLCRSKEYGVRGSKSVP